MPALDVPTTLQWIATFGVHVLLATSLALRPERSLRARFLLAIVALCAPLLCPSRGVMSTIATGLSIVLSCRIADLARRPHARGPELLLWLLCPAVRSWPSSQEERRASRRRAARTLARALGKRLAWEPIGAVSESFGLGEAHWLVRSSVLMLYFVLNVTALADVVLAACQLLGATTDELFDWPLLSSSPREFWSRRWNRFINRFALKHVALPLRARLSESALVALVFAASGVFHEYFAWGVSGEGTAPFLMMTFFLIQGGSVIVGIRLPLLARGPRLLRHALTFLWMALLAPLFFRPLVPALLELEVTPAEFPWTDSFWGQMPGF